MGANVPSGAEPGEAGETEACAHTEYVDGQVPEEFPKTGDGATGAEVSVWDELFDVEDPEMPVSVVDLGLIYGVEVDPETAHCVVEMTLTYSGCPARDMLMDDVANAAESAEGVETAEVHLRYTPQWTVEMVTERGREHLREFGLSL